MPLGLGYSNCDDIMTMKCMGVRTKLSKYENWFPFESNFLIRMKIGPIVLPRGTKGKLVTAFPFQPIQ